jgi:hypothetical protein
MGRDSVFVFVLTQAQAQTVNRQLKHVGRQHDGDGNQYNESMKINK